MVRFLFRILASVALAGAVIMAIVDITRSIAASSIIVTSLLSNWSVTSPSTLSAFQTSITTRLPAIVWDPIMVTILRLPGSVVFAGLALVLYALGRQPSARGRFLPET